MECGTRQTGWRPYLLLAALTLLFFAPLVCHPDQTLYSDFSDLWLLHLPVGGHYITIGLAWLPLVVLLLEQAIARGSIVHATGAGVVYAFMVLAMHPQWTFYSGLFIALWTLAGVLSEEPGRSRWT